MKKLNMILLCAVTLSFASCNKNEVEIKPMGAINITNAIISGSTVKMGTALRDSAIVNDYKRWSFISGDTEFRIFPTNSPSTPYFNQTVKTKEGEWYSLFLTGTALNVESIFLKENLPAFTSEQCAIRVVNLSPSGSSLNVTLSSTPTMNEFSNLVYKQVTAFKTYAVPFTATTTNFTFQIRDSGSANVLTTFSLDATQIRNIRYKSASLVITGMVGGTGTSALGVLYVPNY